MLLKILLSKRLTFSAKTKKITVRMPADLEAALTEIATANNHNLSSLINTVMDQFALKCIEDLKRPISEPKKRST